jgi:hypothetical protein
MRVSLQEGTWWAQRARWRFREEEIGVVVQPATERQVGAAACNKM